MSDVEQRPNSPDGGTLMGEATGLFLRYPNLVAVDLELERDWGVDDLRIFDDLFLGGLIVTSEGRFTEEIEIWNHSNSEDGTIIDICFGTTDDSCIITANGAFDPESGKRLDADRIEEMKYWLKQSHWSRARSQIAAERKLRG